MPRYYTDDPIADFNRHDRDQQKWLDSRPKCYVCGEAIQTDICYGVDGHKYCLDCHEEAAAAALEQFVESTI